MAPIMNLRSGDTPFVRIGEALIGERFRARLDVAFGVFSGDVVGDPFFDEGQCALAHFRLLWFRPMYHSSKARSPRDGA
jgi:hypothetical protein